MCVNHDVRGTSASSGRSGETMGERFTPRNGRKRRQSGEVCLFWDGWLSTLWKMISWFCRGRWGTGADSCKLWIVIYSSRPGHFEKLWDFIIQKLIFKDIWESCFWNNTNTEVFHTKNKLLYLDWNDLFVISRNELFAICYCYFLFVFFFCCECLYYYSFISRFHI